MDGDLEKPSVKYWSSFFRFIVDLIIHISISLTEKKIICTLNNSGEISNYG